MLVSKMRAYRQLQGLSLYDVGRAAGISASMLSLVERGFRQLTNEDKGRVAQVLGCELEMIFDDEDAD